ncbi:TPA: hypothetical protein EYP66_21500 [Candidatus Poribacteria bacterium]|nr:hypothetical protein [Candidatus Poribacteria bacterium]
MTQYSNKIESRINANALVNMGAISMAEKIEGRKVECSEIIQAVKYWSQSGTSVTDSSSMEASALACVVSSKLNPPGSQPIEIERPKSRSMTLIALRLCSHWLGLDGAVATYSDQHKKASYTQAWDDYHAEVAAKKEETRVNDVLRKATELGLQLHENGIPISLLRDHKNIDKLERQILKVTGQIKDPSYKGNAGKPTLAISETGTMYSYIARAEAGLWFDMPGNRISNAISKGSLITNTFNGNTFVFHDFKDYVKANKITNPVYAYDPSATPHGARIWAKSLESMSAPKGFIIRPCWLFKNVMEKPEEARGEAYALCLHTHIHKNESGGSLPSL